MFSREGVARIKQIRSSALLLSLPLLLTATGCAGYQLGSVKPERFQEIHSIAIPTFKNETLEPRSSVLLTNSVIKRFQEDGTYRISSIDDADAILYGTFSEIRRSQLRALPTDNLETRELGILLTVNYDLKNAHSGKSLDRGTVSGNTAVFLDPSVQLSERQALPLAADELAGELVSRLSEGW